MKQMRYVLIIAEKPPTTSDGLIAQASLKDPWRRLVAHAKVVLQQLPGSRQLAENVWQLPLDSGLSQFASLIRKCSDEGFPSQSIFFDSEPEWIDTKPQPPNSI